MKPVDYLLLAATIQEARQDCLDAYDAAGLDSVDIVADNIANMFARVDPTFDRHTFLVVCGTEEEKI